jgi:DNA-binding GntR family transcriptional regulator
MTVEKDSALAFRPRKVDVAYERLTELLVTRGSEPGALIDDSSLMNRLHVGRAPFREAVPRLSHEGLVVHIPRRGSWARSLSLIDLRHMVETRRIVEPAAACAAAHRISSAQIERIRDELDRSEAMVAAGDYAGCVYLDLTFHSMVAQASRNPSLMRMVDHINRELMRFWCLSFAHVRDPELPFQQHRLILNMLRKGGLDGAKRIMHEHFDLFLARVQEHVRQMGRGILTSRRENPAVIPGPVSFVHQWAM